MADRDRRDMLAWQAQSVLIGYPDLDLVERLGLLRRVADALERPVGEPMRRFLDHVDRAPLPELAADYVATFDQRKRCCLFLTYYAFGDTRKRGMALLRLKQEYAAGGARIVDDELPDHLAVLLEYAGTHPDRGRALLIEHRAGLELLRLALRDGGSPWAAVLDSVSATLPRLGGDERQAVARLAAQGPPAEEVGLAPFAPPDYMPPSGAPVPRMPAPGASVSGVSASGVSASGVSASGVSASGASASGRSRGLSEGSAR